MFAYEKLEVYKKAKAVNSLIYQFLKNDKNLPGYLKNQLGRAALSIVLNIAEGAGKFSLKDRRNYLVTARGSAFECAAIIDVLQTENEITAELGADLTSKFDEISRMLYAMISNLEKKAA
jgi:four helix bundle protein